MLVCNLTLLLLFTALHVVPGRLLMLLLLRSRVAAWCAAVAAQQPPT
jgi:hypothetical protein